MFRIETNDPDQLKRIVLSGTFGILLALGLIVFNFVLPLTSGSDLTTENIVFGLFGVVALVVATHPTYEAVQRLNGS